MSQSFLPSASIEILQKRAEIIRKIRTFFDEAKFIEVQTPLLSSESIIDQYIDPVAVNSSSLQLPDALSTKQLYLQTSPEFAMKRILAAGAEAIYQICPAVRSGESGAMHNPEFTMLEWYRIGDTFADGIRLLRELVSSVVTEAPCVEQTYQSAFIEHAGFDPLSVTVPRLEQHAQHLGIQYVGSPIVHRDDWLNMIFDQSVAPSLGQAGPLVLTHYPITQAALAQVCEEDPRTCERFELFIRGIELANGYGELLDAEELRLRCDATNEKRTMIGKDALPVPQQLLQAMAHGLPRCSGCALGVDRLVCLMLDKHDIRHVMSFPISRA